jgi:hypothetical protein
MVVEKVKNPGICKMFGSLGKLRGKKNSMLPPKKLGILENSREMSFRMLEKKIGSLRNFMLPDNLGRLYRLLKKNHFCKKKIGNLKNPDAKKDWGEFFSQDALTKSSGNFEIVRLLPRKILKV